MSGEEDCRQYQSLRKYEVVLNQFNELIDAVDRRTRAAKKHRKSKRSKKEQATASQQSHKDEVLADTLTRCLNDFNAI